MWKIVPPPPRKIEKASRICKFSKENPAVFCLYLSQKYTSKSWFLTNICGKPPPPAKSKKLRGFINFQYRIRPFLPFFGSKIQKYIHQFFYFLIVILDEFWIFYPIILMAFLVQFLIFPKKTDFQVKKFKKTESPKMVSKRL